MMMQPVTIAVGGGSGSGKSTICSALRESLGGTAVLDLDSYYLDRSALSPVERARLNFDEPAAFDVPLLVRQLAELRAGRPIEKPRYSFAEHVRQGTARMTPAPVIVVEGLFALWWPEIRDLLDLKVFVDAPEETRFRRRLQRDVTTRGRTPESVEHQFDITVRPMHARYVEPTRLFADVVLVNDHELARSVDLLRAAVTDLRALRPSRPGAHVSSA
jgi:uridine kinase